MHGLIWFWIFAHKIKFRDCLSPLQNNQLKYYFTFTSARHHVEAKLKGEAFRIGEFPVVAPFLKALYHQDVERISRENKLAPRFFEDLCRTSMSELPIPFQIQGPRWTYSFTYQRSAQNFAISSESVATPETDSGRTSSRFECERKLRQPDPYSKTNIKGPSKDREYIWLDPLEFFSRPTTV